MSQGYPSFHPEGFWALRRRRGVSNLRCPARLNAKLSSVSERKNRSLLQAWRLPFPYQRPRRSFLAPRSFVLTRSQLDHSLLRRRRPILHGDLALVWHPLNWTTLPERFWNRQNRPLGILWLSQSAVGS